MVILFTFWYVLGWQFPVWLWVISGIMFLASFSGKVNAKKNTSISLPLSVALGLTFGLTAQGAPLILDGQGWTIFWIFIGSGIILGTSVSANNSIKRKNDRSI